MSSHRKHTPRSPAPRHADPPLGFPSRPAAMPEVFSGCAQGSSETEPR